MTVQDVIHDLSEVLCNLASDRYNLYMSDNVRIVKGDFFDFSLDTNGDYILTLPIDDE